ncbi:MAG: RNA methyltransferase [Betaproteobacteria bacterium]|nr:RNA methyltransferase [Betaproteobacteria bacterium]
MSIATSRFVLVNTSHAGNVGAAARALKVMGFAQPGQLVLLSPRHADVATRDEALALASGATDVLAAAAVTDDWAGALADATTTVALTARGRDFGPPAHALRDLCAQLAAQHDARVAFVFGSERYGLPNEIVYKCDAIAHIPANPAYASLNLAQSVMLVAYEWSMALSQNKSIGALQGTPASPPVEPRASQRDVEAMLAHLEQALVSLGYLDPAAPKKLMPRLQRLLKRAQPSEQEVHILRGIAKAVLDKVK